MGEPIDDAEAKEFRDWRSYQFFSHNHPYGVNDLSLGSRQGKDKEQDIIEVCYKIIMEQKEKLRKIKEIKSFFNELSSSSSSFQQPNISLGQTPVIGAISPPAVTIPRLDPTPQSQAPLPQEQEQKKEIINPGTDLIVNSLITSTFMVEDYQRKIRGEGEDLLLLFLKNHRCLLP
jgi:hypothetical protein